MADCQVPWGDTKLSLPLPENWTLAQLASPAARPAPTDWPERLAVALTRPEGMPPLADLLAQLPPQGRIMLVLEDITRHSPLTEILPIILREIEHARIRDEQVEVIFASGMHPPMTPEQVRDKIGPLADRFAWRCNDCNNPKLHKHLGSVPLAEGHEPLEIAIDRRVAEADLRIVVTSVTPHLQAGFGGGAKMFVPGCAQLHTISHLHSDSLPSDGQQLVGSEGVHNAMRQMIDAAGDLIDASGGRTFSIQYLLDDNDKPSAIATGDLKQGQQMLAKQCAAVAGIMVDSPADILITDAAPRDYDLWQSFKCIANTRWAVRENGVIIVLARCPGGMNMPSVRWPLSPTWTRRVVRLLGVKGIVSMSHRLMPRVHHEARFFIQLATETIHRNPILMYAPELLSRGQKFPGLAMYGDLQKTFAAADSLLGEGSRRVLVFSAGGASYPVMRS